MARYAAPAVVPSADTTCAIIAPIHETCGLTFRLRGSSIPQQESSAKAFPSPSRPLWRIARSTLRRPVACTPQGIAPEHRGERIAESASLPNIGAGARHKSNPNDFRVQPAPAAARPEQQATADTAAMSDGGERSGPPLRQQLSLLFGSRRAPIGPPPCLLRFAVMSEYTSNIAANNPARPSQALKLLLTRCLRTRTGRWLPRDPVPSDRQRQPCRCWCARR